MPLLLATMVQDFVIAAYRWLLSSANVLRHLVPWIVVAAVAAIALWIALRKLDPETAQLWKGKLSENKTRLKQFSLLGLSLLLLCGTLVQAKKIVRFRQMTVEEAPASRRKVPQLGGIVQYAPRVGVMESKTYTRTLTLPPSYVDRIGNEGLQILSPYLSDPSAENVTKLVDSFKRSGSDVVFTRELTRTDEVPISADAAEVRVQFNHHGSASGHRYYDAVFDGQYRFRNPDSKPAVMRLTMPLPQGGGTVQGFYIQSGNNKIAEPDQHGEYAWTDTVAPFATVVVNTHYSITGSHGYAYALGSEQRRIGAFHMVAVSSQAPRYVKAGIYPTSTSGNASDWKLNDVITAQSIMMTFPSLDLDSQLLDKTLALSPLVLLLFGIVSLLICPQRAFLACIGFGVGLLGMAVLSAYTTPFNATLLGAGLAAIAGIVSLRTITGAIASIGCAIVSVGFVTVEHGALVAWSLCMIVIAALLAFKRGDLAVLA